MSSTDNLMSLLNQLQMMESTVTDFMMETILRFQRLTDAKVFLLVERNGIEPKRRYCGSQELLRHYGNGGLTQQSNDHLVELDSSVEVLVDRRSNKRTLDREFATNLGMWSTSTDNPDATPAKRNHVETSGNERSNLSSSNGEGDQVPSRETHQSNGYVPTLHSSFKNEIDDCVVIDDDDYESEIYEDLNPEYALKDSNASQVDSITERSSSEENMLNILKQENGSDLGSTFFNRLQSPELQEKKLTAILTTNNPYAAYVKGTVEYKVWRSVLYQVGKNFALNCPFADRTFKNNAARIHFANQCDKFMQHCSALLVDKNKRPEVEIPQNDCLKDCKVVGFIRHSIRHGYLYIVR